MTNNNIDSPPLRKRRIPLEYIIFSLLLFFIYLTSFYEYLLFHTLAELFSIVIGSVIFTICWNSRKNIDNSYFLVIGVSFLFIGFLDLIHSLAYTGMNIFQGYDTNLPAQLWIAARYLQAFSFLFASFVLDKKIRMNYLILSYTFIAGLLIVLIFLKVFPICFIEGTGLTPFKIISEYIIDFLLFLSILTLYKNRFNFERRIYLLLLYSIISTIIAELAFTLYTHAYGLPNLLGHIFKIITFFLLYKAIINIGLENPVNLLFRRLKLSEEKYRSLVDNISDAIFEMDLTGDITYISPQIFTISGFKAEDLLNTNFFDLVFLDDLELIKNKHKKTIERSEIISTEFRLKHKEKNYIFVSLRGHIIEREGIAKIIGIIRDISLRKNAEMLLEQSEEKYRLLVETAQEGIWAINENARTTFVNPRMAEILGYTVDEMFGKHLFEFMDEKAHKFAQINIERRMQGIKEQHDFEFLRKDGKKVYTRLETSPLFDEKNQYSGAIAYIADITERKEAEEKLKQLISTVSHELRTPISVLLMSLDYLKNHKEKVETNVEEKLMEGIYRNVELLHKLADDLLIISRIDEKRVDLEWIEYSPFNIINDILTLMEPVGAEKEIKFNIDIDKNLRLKGDPKRVDQIFRIFIDNAIKYSNKNAIVEIKALENYKGNYNENGETGVLFQFKDTGRGISEEDLPHIFERFFRSNNVSEIPGTGLGLFIAKELIQLHKGKVFVSSKLGEGTTFYIFLPLLNNYEK